MFNKMVIAFYPILLYRFGASVFWASNAFYPILVICFLATCPEMRFGTWLKIGPRFKKA